MGVSAVKNATVLKNQHHLCVSINTGMHVEQNRGPTLDSTRGSTPILKCCPGIGGGRGTRGTLGDSLVAPSSWNATGMMGMRTASLLPSGNPCAT